MNCTLGVAFSEGDATFCTSACTNTNGQTMSLPGASLLKFLDNVHPEPGATKQCGNCRPTSLTKHHQNTIRTTILEWRLDMQSAPPTGSKFNQHIHIYWIYLCLNCQSTDSEALKPKTSKDQEFFHSLPENTIDGGWLVGGWSKNHVNIYIYIYA